MTGKPRVVVKVTKQGVEVASDLPVGPQDLKAQIDTRPTRPDPSLDVPQVPRAYWAAGGGG